MTEQGDKGGYPPLTSLAEYPLHGWDYGDDYACQRPEDPDAGQYDWRCGLCLMAAEASLAVNGDRPVGWRLNAEDPEQEVRLSWLIARSRYWLLDRPAARRAAR